MESVQSTTFIKKPPAVTDRDEKFLYTKELLTNRIFSGFYRERKYVSNLNEYRDVVIICPEEHELIDDVDRLRKKWVGVSGIKWVGLTGSENIDKPQARCLWVKLKDLAFGHYWFLVKHVKLKDEEVFLQLKCLRKSYRSEIQADHLQLTTGRNEEPDTSTSVNKREIFPKLDLYFEAVASPVRTTFSKGYERIYSHLTLKNFIHMIRTTCTFLGFLVVGVIYFIGNFGEFVLKLLREVTFFMHAFSPIVVQVIDFLTKVVGGLFILIAGMFGSNRNPNYVQRCDRPPIQQAPINWRERNERLRRELFLIPRNR